MRKTGNAINGFRQDCYFVVVVVVGLFFFFFVFREFQLRKMRRSDGSSKSKSDPDRVGNWSIWQPDEPRGKLLCNWYRNNEIENDTLSAATRSKHAVKPTKKPSRGHLTPRDCKVQKQPYKSKRIKSVTTQLKQSISTPMSSPRVTKKKKIDNKPTEPLVCCTTDIGLVSCFPSQIEEHDLQRVLPSEYHHRARILAGRSQSQLGLCRAVKALRQSNFDFWKAQELMSRKGVTFSCSNTTIIL